MMIARRPTTELERRNVDAVTELLAENDLLRERIANRNLIIVMLCLAIIVISMLGLIA